jgi:hypothetical protein
MHPLRAAVYFFEVTGTFATYRRMRITFAKQLPIELNFAKQLPIELIVLLKTLLSPP